MVSLMTVFLPCCKCRNFETPKSPLFKNRTHQPLSKFTDIFQEFVLDIPLPLLQSTPLDLRNPHLYRTFQKSLPPPPPRNMCKANITLHHNYGTGNINQKKWTSKKLIHVTVFCEVQQDLILRLFLFNAPCQFTSLFNLRSPFPA